MSIRKGRICVVFVMGTTLSAIAEDLLPRYADSSQIRSERLPFADLHAAHAVHRSRSESRERRSQPQVATASAPKVLAADTSSAPGWTETNRAKGQCAVTACVVQDYFGGDILNTVATLPSSETVSHYFNVVDGETIDLTREQFPEGTTFTRPAAKPGRYSSTREYCLSYESTRLRYEKLRSRVANVIGGST
jgi:hypothetical protein